MTQSEESITRVTSAVSADPSLARWMTISVSCHYDDFFRHGNAKTDLEWFVAGSRLNKQTWPAQANHHFAKGTNQQNRIWEGERSRRPILFLSQRDNLILSRRASSVGHGRPLDISGEIFSLYLKFGKISQRQDAMAQRIPAKSLFSELHDNSPSLFRNSKLSTLCKIYLAGSLSCLYNTRQKKKKIPD